MLFNSHGAEHARHPLLFVSIHSEATQLHRKAPLIPGIHRKISGGRKPALKEA
jgi:hypothetical protein